MSGEKFSIEEEKLCSFHECSPTSELSICVCVEEGVLLRGMAASRHRACSLGDDYSVSDMPRRTTRTEGAMRTRSVAISVVIFIIFHLPHLHVLTMC